MINAVVIGASGYSGAECASILLRHPSARLVGLFGSSKRGATADAPAAISDLFPRFAGVCELPVGAFDEAALLALKPDAVFLATPHEVSHELAPRLLELGLLTIDISGAFRLKDPDVFRRAYGFEQRHAALTDRAAYGIPEINRAAVAKANLIACAGCYATCAILPLAPLADAGALDLSAPVVIDATSGVSGAGRAPSQTVHLSEVSLQPYKVLAHRHAPEIAQRIGVEPFFVPHLGAFDRGILSTIHATLKPGWTGARVRETLDRAYADSQFVHLLPSGRFPAVRDVERTNNCQIGVAADDARRHLVLVSALDNLVKGAAGQAVQCMNIRLGLPETAGLS